MESVGAMILFLVLSFALFLAGVFLVFFLISSAPFLFARRRNIYHELRRWCNRLFSLSPGANPRVPVAPSFGGVYGGPRGEVMRSLSEVRVAEWLVSNGLNYEHEREVAVSGMVFKPDFYLTDRGVFIEFFGLMGKDWYRTQAEFKKSRYGRYGIPFIDVYPKDLENLDEAIGGRLPPEIRIVK